MITAERAGWSKVYTNGDYDKIASAIGKPVAAIELYGYRLEKAAGWYRLDARGTTPQPAAVRKSLARMEKYATLLLQIFENVDDEANERAMSLLADGNRLLRYQSDMAELVDMIEQARTHLDRPPGNDRHKGNETLNVWLYEMIRLYELLASKKAAISMQPITGLRYGPFVRFIEAVSGPVLDKKLTPDQLNERLRGIRKHSAKQSLKRHGKSKSKRR